MVVISIKLVKLIEDIYFEVKFVLCVEKLLFFIRGRNYCYVFVYLNWFLCVVKF